jgi:DNA polymerase-3 subunit gamma/tau
MRIMHLLAAGDAKGIIEAIREIDEQFPDYARLLDDIARDLQRIAVFQVVGSSDSEDEFSEQEIAGLAEIIPTEDVQLFYQVAVMGRRDLHLAPDPRGGAEMTLLRMLAFKPAAAETTGSAGGGVTPASDAAAVPRSKARVVQAASVKTSSGAVTASATQWSDPDWSKLVSELQLGGAVRLLASNCGFVRREGNTVHLALDPRSESMLTKQRKDSIASALSEHFAEQLLVDIAIGAAEVETPIQQESRMADEKLEEARLALEADPNVQALKTMFGAELKTDTIELLSGDKG